MGNKSHSLFIISVILIISLLIAGVILLGLIGTEEDNSAIKDNRTDSERSVENNPEQVNNNSSENEEPPGDGGNNSRESISLMIEAKPVNGETVENGRITLYSANSGGQMEQVANRRLSQGTSHTFHNLTAGERYTVEIESDIFPAENFTIEANETEQFTAEFGYKLHGADAYINEYEVRELGINDNDQVYSDQVFIGESKLDSDNDFYTSYNSEYHQGNPSVDSYDYLYVAEYNESFKNLQSTTSGWSETHIDVGPYAQSSEIVMKGLSAYNRTFVEEIQRNGEIYHRYEIDVGTVDVNPETGYVVYVDINVEDDEEVVYDRNRFSNHDSEDLEAIPEDFDPPSSDDNQTAGG